MVFILDYFIFDTYNFDIYKWDLINYPLFIYWERQGLISLACASEDNLELLILWPPLLELQVDVTPFGLFSAGDQTHTC